MSKTSSGPYRDRRPVSRAVERVSAVGETKSLNGRQWLLLYVYRHWITGLATSDARHLEFAWSEIATTSGPAPARRVLSALEVLLGTLSDHARRRICYHPPCCGVTAADELRVLNLLTSLQRGRRAAAEANAQVLVRPSGLPSLLEAADNLAEALSAAGLELDDAGEATLH